MFEKYPHPAIMDLIREIETDALPKGMFDFCSETLCRIIETRPFDKVAVERARELLSLVQRRNSNIGRHIGVTATQIGLTEIQKKRAHQVIRALNPDWMHNGCCIGGDDDLYKSAILLGVSVCLHPPINTSKMAQMDVYARKMKPFDYLVRNKHIVAASEILLACPKEQDGEEIRSGTWSTVRYARRLSKRIVIVRPTGKIEEET